MFVSLFTIRSSTGCYAGRYLSEKWSEKRLRVRLLSRQLPLTKRKLCLKTHYRLQCSIQFFHCDRLDQMLGKTGFKASGRICLRPESAHRDSDKHASRFCHQFHATSIGQADVAD